MSVSCLLFVVWKSQRKYCFRRSGQSSTLSLLRKLLRDTLNKSHAHASPGGSLRNPVQRTQGPSYHLPLPETTFSKGNHQLQYLNSDGQRLFANAVRPLTHPPQISMLTRFVFVCHVALGSTLRLGARGRSGLHRPTEFKFRT